MKKILSKHICENQLDLAELLYRLPLGSIVQFWAYDRDWPDLKVRGLIEVNVIEVISDAPYKESMGR